MEAHRPFSPPRIALEGYNPPTGKLVCLCIFLRRSDATGGSGDLFYRDPATFFETVGHAIIRARGLRLPNDGR